MSRLETALGEQLRWAGLEGETQYPFAKEQGRRFRFDFAWPGLKLAVEVEGGLWSRGESAHKHPLGILRDIEKGNLAVLLGWRVLRVTGDMIQSGEALRLIQQVMEEP